MTVDRNLLIEQARIVGSLVDLDRVPSAAEKVELEGVWNLLHALLDVPEGGSAVVEVRE